MKNFQDQPQIAKTINLIESYHSGPSRDTHELYKRIFRAKDKELIGVFTQKAAKLNDLDEEFPLLRVKIVQENEDLEFDIQDLEYTFAIFGKIERMIMKPKGVAFIQYSTFLEAFFAQRALNNYKIPDSNCCIQVQVCSVVNSSQSLKQDLGSTFVFFISQIDNEAQLNPNYGYYTKFLIDIEDPNFNVIDRVLGQRGCNLLRIQFMVSKQVEGAELKNDLLLKVGAKNRNIFVIIQGQSYEKFNNACKLMHELIANIYEGKSLYLEYKRYCEFRDIPYPTNLRLKREEKYQNECQLIFQNK